MQSYHMHWEPLPVLPLRMQAVFAVNTAIKQFKILRRNEINCYPLFDVIEQLLGVVPVY